ncbi:MAG: transporter substrate-binding protein [Acidimicrobiaceae bacterium]|nr:transporter substrate-binding protein [Acidimicrobiaceae bacterium]
MYRSVRLRVTLGALALVGVTITGAIAGTAGASAKAPAPRATAGGAFPVTISTAAGPLTIKKRPTRVVSLSPTATEMLFAIGAGHQVVAVDSDSNYPPSAPHTSLSGYTPNVEAIAKERPDLVVISYNPTPPNLESSLKLLGIPVLYLPAGRTLADTYFQLSQLGQVTGDRTEAQALAAKMRTDVAGLVAQVPKTTHPTYFYELDPTLYTATGDTFVGSVLTLAGLKDITGASVHGSDYPQLSSEAVLKANPTFIFLADGASLASVSARPGWSQLAAVRNHRVIELNQDIASRWGPRVVDLLHSVVTAELKAKAA